MFTWIASLFGTPWMLAWLPLAAVPVLIHLWNRRKVRETSWAAMEYLLAAIVKSSRRMRIEQLLLLLVRVLLLILVVLALAEPFLSRTAMPFRTDARIHRVLVLDGSYSMGYRPSDRSRFEWAQEAAVRIVERSGEGDAFSLIVMTDRPRVVIGRAAYDRADVIEEIENLKLVDGGADLDSAMQAVEEVVRKVRNEQRQLAGHHVYVLSDLGRNTWSAEAWGPAIDKRLRARLARLTEQGRVEVLPIGRPNSANLAVTSLRTAQPYVTVAEPARIIATIRNFSDSPKLHQRVELWIDRRRVDQKTVEIRPGDETPPVVFEHRFPLPGDHVVEVRVEGDPLEVDNRRYLVLPVKQHLEALLVRGKRRATLPIEAALGGRDAEGAVAGKIRAHVVSESALLEADLSQYDCIFLCNVGQLTAREAHVLERYVQQGGGLVTFLGDQVSVDRYNQELMAGSDGGRHVLPAKLGEPRFDGDYHFIDPLEFRHPMLRLWRGNPKAGLTTVPISKYVRLEVPEGSDANIVAKLDTGDPLIVEESIGRGRSILVATDASTTSTVETDSHRPWSLLASWLNSQPFFESLWKAAVGGRIDERNVLVGEPLTSRLDEDDTGGQRVAIVIPSSSPEARSAAAEDATAVVSMADGTWTYADTDWSGYYDVRVGSELGALRPFAVNVDTQESNLETLDGDELPDAFTLLSDWQSDASIDSPVGEPPALALHQLLLVTVLGLLFIETLLAWWIGARSA